MLSAVQSIVRWGITVSNSEPPKIPSELPEFTETTSRSLGEAITEEIVRMSKSGTFCQFTFTDRMTIKIPFRIAHKEDAQELLKFIENTRYTNLIDFKKFLETLAENEKIDLPKNVEERMAEIGLQVTESLKYYFSRNSILVLNKVSYYVDCFPDLLKNCIRIQLWTGPILETPPEFLENDSSERQSSINSHFESSFRSDFTRSEVAALASNITKAELDDFFLFGPEYSKYIKITFPCAFRRKYPGVLKYVPDTEPSLKNFFRNISQKTLANFPEDIDGKISKFGQQVTEHLKKLFEADENIKSRKVFYQIIWVDKPERKGIKIRLSDHPIPNKSSYSAESM